MGTINYVPTYLVHSLWFGETASDNWFVGLDGEKDFLADMFIGRLPARTTTEAKIMVDKILNYENLPNGQDWTKKVMLVADNDLVNFESISNDLAGMLPLEYSGQKIFLRNYATAASCRTDIINGINDGRLLVNYTGHGSIRIWAAEKIFQVSNISSLTNANMLPLVVTPTCFNGYFILPKAYNYEALAEELVRRSARGAIAAFSPSGISHPGDQQILVEGLFKAMFKNGDFRLGPATTLAKFDLFKSGSADAENVNQTYILFGDPALKLKMSSEGNWDKVAPQVVGTLPENAKKDASISTEIRIEFSEPMNEIFTKAGFSISPFVSGKFSWSGNSLVFKPDSPLDYETTYTVTLLACAQDLAGNTLDGNGNAKAEGSPVDDYQFKFFTASRGYAVSGKVTLPGEEGLSAVQINLSGDASTTVSTDTNGNYTFTGIANGSYTITPDKEGYKFAPKNKKLTVSGSDVSGVNFIAHAQPSLRVNPDSLDFGSSQSVKTFEISNTGKGSLKWTATADKSWLSVEPSKGKTTTETDTVTVSVNRSDLAAGTYIGKVSVSSDGGNQDIDVTIIVIISEEIPDTTVPYLSEQNPANGEMQVPRDTNILFHIKDHGKGVDCNTISLSVDGEEIIKDGVKQEGKDAKIQETPDSPNDYIISYDSKKDFKYEQIITVMVKASDLASPANLLSTSYSFTTEMMTIGPNIRVNDSRSRVICDHSSMVASPDGKNIYIVWEEQDLESKKFSIYFDKSTDRGKTFEKDIKVLIAPDAGDQRFPKIALQTNQDIYVVWQQKNLEGNWNIYLAKSIDKGKSFTEPKRIDAYLGSGNQTLPTIDVRSNDEVYVAWVDERESDNGIYFAASQDKAENFGENVRVDDTSAVYPTHPSLKADSNGDIYISWSAQAEDTDKYNIYFDRGKKSKGKGKTKEKIWEFGTDVQANAEIFNAAYPSLNVSPSGRDVYIAWQSLKDNDEDISFSKSIDYGESFEGSISVVDDSGSRPQRHPSLAADNNGDIYIAWEDFRWTESDIYLAYSINEGDKFKTNILINDDKGKASQSNPCLALDDSGKCVFITWTDYREGGPNIYFTGSTAVNVYSSSLIERSRGGKIKVSGGTNIDRAETQISAGSLKVDTTITVGEVENSPSLPSNIKGVGSTVYFGPGKTIFNNHKYATIKIPYTSDDLSAAGVGDPADLKVYYYNKKTETWEEVPVTGVDKVNQLVSAEVTHFSIFGLGYSGKGGGESGGSGGESGGSGGGGSCFIATAAYGTPLAKEVKALYEFRDRYLLSNEMGRKLMKFYYRVSPPIADYIRDKEALKAIVRVVLKPFIRFISFGARHRFVTHWKE